MISSRESFSPILAVIIIINCHTPRLARSWPSAGLNLVEVDGAIAILVDVRDHLADLLLLWLESEGTHSDLELLGINAARAVGVEQVEGLPDLLLLLLCEVSLAGLLGALGSSRSTSTVRLSAHTTTQLTYALPGRAFVSKSRVLFPAQRNSYPGERHSPSLIE